MRKPFYWKDRKGWYIRIDGDDGSLKTVRLADKKTAAYREWQAMQRRAELSASDPASPLVVDILAEYIEHLGECVTLGQIAKKTADRRTDYLSPFLAHVDQTLRVSELKPHHVSKWLRTRKRWNATTRHHAAEALKRAIGWAVDEGTIDKNPIAKLKVQKGPPRDHVISREEYESLLAGVWNDKYSRRWVTSFRAVLIGLRLSGCRPGEITTIDVSDTDGSIWTIRQHKTKKKKLRTRNVYLSPCLQTLTAIAAHGRKSGPLFRPATDRRWEYSDLRRRFERLRKRAKANPKCVLYSFRHTWITNALLAGVDVATVAEMAGTSIQMIDRHYGHLAQQRKHLIESAEQVAKFQASRSLSEKD